MAAEKELDRILEVALRNNEGFRNWLVAKSKFKGNSPECVFSRSDNPWCTVMLQSPDPKTGEIQWIKRQSETDILFVFVFPNERDRKLAIHIENKLSSGTFTKYQPESYAKRAKFWIRNPKYGNYDEWDTMLLAPLRFRERNIAGASQFGCFVAHEEVAKFLPEFECSNS